MNSCIVLVDAGYVYAAGGLLVHGTQRRRELSLDPGKLRDHLEAIATKLSGVRLLRTYWYDAARDRRPTREQRRVARLPAVHLRVGRMTSQGMQKGVDSLVYRDLFTLSRSGRLSDIFLLSGDEDLLEGVLAAQEMGVRVASSASNRAEAISRTCFARRPTQSMSFGGMRWSRC